MPNIDAQWLIDKRVIYACASGKSTIAFFEAHNRRMLTLLDAGDAPVYVILENQNFQPPVIGIRRTIELLSFTRHPSLGYVVFINEGNPALNFASQLIAKFLRIRMKRAETIPKALDFLIEIVPDLDTSQINYDVLEQATRC